MPIKRNEFNRARMESLLSGTGIDALIAASPSNINYFSGYFWWLDTLMRDYMMQPGASIELPENYVLIGPNIATRLICPTSLSIALRGGWTQEISSYGTPYNPSDVPPSLASTDAADKKIFDHFVRGDHAPNAAEALVRAVKAAGLDKGRLGLDMDWLSAQRIASLKLALPNATLVNCSNLMRLVRAVKTSAEVALLRQAAQISETAWQQVFASCKPGDDLRATANAYRVAIAQQGADLDHFAYVPLGLGMALECPCPLDASTLMYIDVGCIYEHYFSDTGFTISTGKPSASLIADYDIFHDCIANAETELKPGAKSSAARKNMTAFLAKHKIEGAYPHGHGIGLDIRDYPILNDPNKFKIQDDCVSVDSDLILEPGMVINLEASIFRPGFGSVGVEKTYVITEHGFENLIPQDRRVPVVIS